MASGKFLFFDLGWTIEDETLAQMDRASKAAELVRGYGIETTADRILALQEDAARAFAPSVFRYALSHLGLADDQVQAVLQEARWDKGKLCLYPDAKPTLDILRQHHSLGLIANQSPGTRERLRRYGIRKRFTLILASDEAGMEKPDPRLFALALEKAGCHTEEAWMVGDRLDNDIRPAKQAGWHTIRVLQGYNRCQEPRDILDQPDYTVDDLAQIVPMLS